NEKEEKVYYVEIAWFKEDKMITRARLKEMKEKKEKIAMVTAYDYPSAKQVATAGSDMILVGDSLGMVVLGYDSTIQVTLDDMIHHGKAVNRGANDCFVVVDMPFMSYHASVEDGVKNATKLFQETKAQALKLEGCSSEILSIIKRIGQGGIAVIGHLGLTPQTVNVLGGYKVQANSKQTVKQLLEDAKAIEAAGAIAIVLECIPKEVGAFISQSLSIPTIGIGAGAACDGQVLVYHDILQYGPESFPKFVKNYADLNKTGVEALSAYVSDVKNKAFPEIEHTYKIKDDAYLSELK